MIDDNGVGGDQDALGGQGGHRADGKQSGPAIGAHQKMVTVITTVLL